MKTNSSFYESEIMEKITQKIPGTVVRLSLLKSHLKIHFFFTPNNEKKLQPTFLSIY